MENAVVVVVREIPVVTLRPIGDLEQLLPCRVQDVFGGKGGSLQLVHVLSAQPKAAATCVDVVDHGWVAEIDVASSLTTR